MADINTEDTIAAVATPVGAGGISVIRVSGPQAFEIAAEVFFPAKKRDVRSLPSHTVHLGEIRDIASQTIDQVLLTVFRAPHSYTAEDVIEISSHGSVIITKQILDLLLEKGARHAEPGEFTKRAFLNGKIDLTQAEAVIDMIHAKSRRSAELASRQLKGALRDKLASLKDELMKIYAHMESFLDFPEEDIEVYSDHEFASRFERLTGRLEALAASFTRGSLIREGAFAVILGKPNVGKSSLFNVLLERDRALVSEFPGTTRDFLEESLEIDGHLVRIADTAGLDFSAEHPLDRMSMEKTSSSLEQADWVIYVVDGSRALDEEDKKVFSLINAGRRVITVINKSDLPEVTGSEELKGLTGGAPVIRISTRTGEGMDRLEAEFRNCLKEQNDTTDGEQITRLRHKKALEKSLTALRDAYRSFKEKKSLELVVIDVKASLDQLRELAGEVYSEDLLDVVFSEFCIGK